MLQYDENQRVKTKNSSTAKGFTISYSHLLFAAFVWLVKWLILSE